VHQSQLAGLAMRIHVVYELAGRQHNTAHYCDTHSNFAGVQLLILANQGNLFYIKNHHN
jgi:hypothetical protein